MTAVAGVVGLGKLGLPMAVTLALRGHEVLAYDVNPDRMSVKALPATELGPDGSEPLADLVDDSLPVRFVELAELVAGADCVFIAVPTPHLAQYEGITPLPDSRADFDYTALCSAVRAVAGHADTSLEIGVVSTVLPGTIRSRVLALAGGHHLVYCPQFVAMGSVAGDLCRPEFILLGRDGDPPGKIERVLTGLAVEAPVFAVSYETAELAKVIYNTCVSAKVAVANTVQRLACEVGASAGDVFRVLGAADRRLASAAYLGTGMGDGGPCHPRDNIALSWLGRRLDLGADLFGALMQVRQSYVEWLAGTFVRAAGGLPLVILGTAYKPGTGIEIGSSAVLLANLLGNQQADVRIVRDDRDLATVPAGPEPAAYFIGCPEPGIVEYRFPPGSVVVDPWHRVPDRPGVRLVRVGEP